MGDSGAQRQGQGGRLDGLLREMSRQASSGAEPDVRKVLDWLHRQTGSDIALVEDAAGTVELFPADFPREEILGPLAPLLGQLAGGGMAAAATRVDELYVHCEALGAHDPRPVLVTASRSAPNPETVALSSHVGSLITLLRRARDADRSLRGYQHKARQLRFAVLSALMAGEPTLARRMTTGAVPPLLDADRLLVYLLHCPPTDRDRIARAHQDPSGYHGQDLMVQCPVFKEHLICLIADENEVEGSGARGRGEALRRLVRDNPHYALGISDPHPLGGTAEAYSQAAHALAVARSIPDRVASYHGQSPLEGILPRGPALIWARTFLRPLDALAKTTVDITRLAMAMPRSAVARLINLSRNTVTAHLRRAEQALGLDLTDVRSRAAVNLALALTSTCADPEPETQHPPPTLDDLLRTDPATAWAQTFLHPLQAQHRRTLQAWIDANIDAQEAARRIGISRNTVRTHLRTAEALLGRDLLTTGAGIHDVVHALHILLTLPVEHRARSGA
ncbi:helix-turn-helix domain-containing protein [Nonomuraea purpurea]|uniref:Helix-turn-helix domain-containing protein n=1 Tax=Nonomuraea purpurea TaxID=1849276 RepID=A0ABV8G7H5_9ACTN